MPQLEQINTFLSQIFWLFVGFGILYFFISRFAAPKLGGVMNERASSIASDVEVATSSRERAVKANAEFTRKTEKVRAEAQAVIAASTKSADENYSNEIASLEAKLRDDVVSAEKDVAISRQKTLESLNKEVSAYVEEILQKIAGLKVDKNSVEKIVSKVTN